MARTTVEQTDASFVYSGAGWSTVSDAAASSGSYAKTSTAGNTVTITVPSGNSGALLLCSRIGRSNVATVTVDGAAMANWSQDAFTTAAASAGQTWTPYNAIVQPIAWQRSAYRPITFANTAIAHTIVIGVVSGTITIDAVELYAAASIVVGRVTTQGHSIGQGNGVTTAQRYSGLVAAAIVGTDDNHCYGSSSLIYDTGNTTFTPPSVGWLEQEGNTGAVGGSVKQVNIGTAGAYSVAPTGATLSGGGGAGATLGTPTTTGSSPSIQVTGVPVTAKGSGFTSAPTVAFTGGTGTAAAATAVLDQVQDSYAAGAHWWGRTPEIAILNHGVNEIATFSATDPGGGAGYVIELFKQRLREGLWRMWLNSPDTITVVCGMNYDSPDAAIFHTYDAAIQAVLAETTTRRAIYLDCWNVIGNNGGVTLTQDNLHPTAAGHALIARDILAAYWRARSRPASRGTLR